MIKKEQCDKMVEEGKMVKTDNIYHIPFDTSKDSIRQILEANDLHVAFSEWWDFYSCMKYKLRKYSCTFDSLQ